MPPLEICILPDGRQLSFIEFGKPGGWPVFYFHGVPASCYEALLVNADEIKRFGLRIIAPDRPGVGRSAFQHDRKFTDWPKDVEALANHLNIERFAVLGNSGGSAYVLACALQIPDRLSAAVIVSGAWQMNLPVAMRNLSGPNRLFWWIAAKLPWLLTTVLRSMRPSGISREKLLKNFRKMMQQPDYEAICLGDRPQAAAEALAGGLSQLKGSATEVRLYVKPSGLDVSGVDIPVYFFHGEQDKNVPIELVRTMIPDLPGVTLIAYQDEAHLSTLCNHFDDIGRVLLASFGKF
jgi:pimeloyl-ACP methyl ester carboxylesterase